MPRPKKGDPELLLVSFCDIVTITTAAMFMAMIVVIDESTRIPAVRPMPLLMATTNQPVFYECRQDQVFPIDVETLGNIFRQRGAALHEQHAGGQTNEAALLSDLFNTDLGNDLYHVDNGYLMMGVMALLPREGTHGTTVKEILDTPRNDFRQSLEALDPKSQYIAFVVRDDSFNVFRRARELATNKKFQSGWDFLDRAEPITFTGAMRNIQVQ